MAAKVQKRFVYCFSINMGQGDLDAVLSVYESDAVFLNQTRELKAGLQPIRLPLSPAERDSTSRSNKSFGQATSP